MSPLYGGVWQLGSSSIMHYPCAIIALNRTVRDGTRYTSGLISTPEESLVEKYWYIGNHWEDQFCREAYQGLCLFDEIQYLRAAALALRGTSACAGSLLEAPPDYVVTDWVKVDTLDLGLAPHSYH